MDNDKNTIERFNGKNYYLWEFAFRMYVMGKELWGIVDGRLPKPDVKSEGYYKWETQNAKVVSWMLSSVEPQIAVHLRPYKTAAAMWVYLRKIYHQDNEARRFQLENDIADFKQGDRSIQDYYSGFMSLWQEYGELVYAGKPDTTVEILQAEHEHTQKHQFLMRLRREFEPLRGSLLNRSPAPTLSICLNDLLREEQRLRSQLIIDTAAPSGPSEVAFTVPSLPPTFSISTPSEVAYAVSPRTKGRDISKVRCFSCQEFGHFASQCKKSKTCNYCKKIGHVITECRRRPQTRGPPDRAQALHVSTDALLPPPGPSTASAGSSLSPEAMQQMQQMIQTNIAAAFSSMGFSGKSDTSSAKWFLDSGASHHMTWNSQPFVSTNPHSPVPSVRTANGHPMPVTAIGNLHPFTSQPSLKLSNVLHIPQLSDNLLSVGQLVDENCNVLFSPHGCFIQDRGTGRLIGKGTKDGSLFSVDLRNEPTHLHPSKTAHFTCFSAISDYSLWHRRLGHPNRQKLNFMITNKLLPCSISFDNKFQCQTCCLAKAKTLPFPVHHGSATSCFDIIHSDVWGVTPVISRCGYKYFVTFIDDFSRFTWVYFLHAKSEVFTVFTQFLRMIETQFSSKIKTLRTDSGGEYTSHSFQDLLRNSGILWERSCPYTPQQNGIAERKHRHILDTVRALLIESSVPASFWVEMVQTAVYLINRQPSSTKGNVTPFYLLHKCPPSYLALHPYGCVCFVLLPPTERHKLSPQSSRCVFVGYATGQKGFLCYDPGSKRMRVSRNVVFLENIYYFSSSTSTTSSLSILPAFSSDSLSGRFKPGLVYTRRSRETMPHPPSPSLSTSSSPAPALRRSSRISVPPDRFGFPSTSLLVSPDIVPIPCSFNQATSYDCWKKAMQDELDALDENRTWDLVPCPPTVKPIGCKWVYTTKLKSDGSLERYKARLVALGNRQEYGIDYDETFAPVAKMTTVRLLLSLAASQNWPLLQMDVKNAFLHGNLSETVYMRPPLGLLHVPPGHVCRLRRSLYGLKQAPRAWFEKLRSTVIQAHFRQSKYDYTMFTRRSSQGITILLVYVDDLLITGSDASGILALRQFLQRQFKMKDLGSAKYFLGLEVHRSPSGIFVNQQKYIHDLVSLARLSSARSVDTPMELNVKLSQDSGTSIRDPTLYRRLVGSLLYLSITRPDISFAVHIVSQFMIDPRHLHMAAVLRIIRYLRGCPSIGLFFPSRNSTCLRAYSDADWAGCPDTRRSTTGWCMFLGSSLISWKCKKQDRVSKSSTEAEYRSMSTACSEILWLRRFLTELGFPQYSPTPLHADNTSAIRIASNPVFHERTKHIEVDCHAIRDELVRSSISLPHVSSTFQLADILTKPMPIDRHRFLMTKLMLRSPVHQFEGECQNDGSVGSVRPNLT